MCYAAARNRTIGAQSNGKAARHSAKEGWVSNVGIVTSYFLLGWFLSQFPESATTLILHPKRVPYQSGSWKQEEKQ